MFVAYQIKPVNSIAETAEILGVCQNTIRNRIKEGRIKKIQDFGRRVLISGDEIKRILSEVN